MKNFSLELKFQDVVLSIKMNDNEMKVEKEVKGIKEVVEESYRAEDILPEVESVETLPESKLFTGFTAPKFPFGSGEKDYLKGVYPTTRFFHMGNGKARKYPFPLMDVGEKIKILDEFSSSAKTSAIQYSMTEEGVGKRFQAFKENGSAFIKRIR